MKQFTLTKYHDKEGNFLYEELKPMMRIGFTGTRAGMRASQLVALSRWLSIYYMEGTEIEFHHGDCVGADHEAHTLAQSMSIPVVIHPPNIQKHRALCKDASEIRGAKDYINRNHDIVDECDVLIAAPHTSREQVRSGTWATIRYARKQGKEVLQV